MIYNVKIEFQDYPSGSWIDWSQYLSQAPTIKKNVESESEGEAGIVIFDNASVGFYYVSGNPVFNAFDPSVIDLTAKVRYLFRISAPKSNGTYIQLFEGMADFSTIQWPELSNEITFDVVDKLTALGVMEILPQRAITTLDSRILDQCPLATAVVFYNDVSGSSGPYNINELWIRPNTTAYLTTPVIFAGEYLQDPSTMFLDGTTGQPLTPKYIFVIKSWIDGIYGNKIQFFQTEVFNDIFYGVTLGYGLCNYVSKNYYGVDIINYDVYNNPATFEALLIIENLITQLWAGITFINLTGHTTLPIPLNYNQQLIDDNPFGTDPLSALKKLADLLQCYMYMNKTGSFVMQAKGSLGSNGTTHSIGSTKIISKTKLYFWDKITDGVTVNAQSFDIDNQIPSNYLIGTGTATLSFPGSAAPITPKNGIQQDLIISPSGWLTLAEINTYEAALLAYNNALAIYNTGHDQALFNTAQTNYNNALILYQSQLNLWAYGQAYSVLSFYGQRHSAKNIVLNLDDNTLDWEILDNIIDTDSIQYFFTSLEYDLVDRTLTLSPIVEVAGHNFDIRQINFGLNNNNLFSSGGNSSSSPSSSVMVSGVLTRNATIGTVYPEDYGAVGNGTTDDTAAIASAISASKGKTLLLSAGTYKVTSPINFDLGGNSIKIIGRNNSTIQFTNTSSAGSYDAPDGCLIFTGGQVSIENITLRGTNGGTEGLLPSPGGIAPNGSSGGGTNTLSVLQIVNCNQVSLNNVIAMDGIYCGIQIINCSNLFASNCVCQYNHYAGLMVRGTSGSQIIGGDYSYNGYDAPNDGYGVTFSGRFPYPSGSTPVDNTNILITGITAINNFRKGIDIHGGIGVQIFANNIRGFGYYGIYAVDENGNTNYEKFVKDVIIQGNIVENDSAFYTALGITWNIEPINVGSFSYESPDLFLAPGAIIVDSNIIRNCDMPGARAMILVFVAAVGPKINAIHIRNNIIMNAVIGFPGDGAIMVTGPSLDPQMVDISNNTIDGNSATSNPAGAGITVLAGELVSVHDNNIRGTWGGGAVNVANNLQQRVYNNTTNNLGLSPSDSASISLPDMISQGTGIFRMNIETSATVPLTMNILTIDSQFYNSGSTSVEVTVRVTSGNLQTNLVYKYSCYIGNNSGVEAYATFHTETDEITGDSTISPPAVIWSTGTGSIHTLQISCGLPFTNYFVETKVGAWRLITSAFN